MEITPSPRLNLLTGDNGLGKSFLLDTAWWVLTGHWPRDVNSGMTTGFPARPVDPGKTATISSRIRGKTKSYERKATYSRSGEAWVKKRARPGMPGLVVYAHANGSFSVWDPARNYWRDQENGEEERLSAYVFSEAEVWDGLWQESNGRSVPVCNGLLLHWAHWIDANNDNARAMATALSALSPNKESEVIRPGPLLRLTIRDGRDIPSIETSYAGVVPILHASAGIRRVCALAYILTWAWSEHRIAAERRGDEIASQIIMLFDEVESHLHPRWQRTILGALRDLGDTLFGGVDIQLLASTHSPLVMASAEPWFDPDKDAWFDLDLEGNPPEAKLRPRPYTLHGTVGSWLTSKAFDLATDRSSVQAENAILRARKILRESNPSLDDVMDTHRELRAALPDVDAFWVRWNAFVESRGGTP